VLIPSGTFIMGNDEDSPRREIFVDAFYLDKYEVTVARYAAFSKASGNVKLPEEWDTGRSHKRCRATGCRCRLAGRAKAIASGAGGVCPPRLNGRRPRAATTNVSFHGASEAPDR
jgi:formylglycine-generating enzyme required for sulfatase activity